MGQRRILGVVGAAAIAIAILALPGVASAKGHHKPPGTSSEFTIPMSNGYLLNVREVKGQVTVVASDAMPPFATISAAGKLRPANTGNVSANSYVLVGTHPSVPDTTIDADLGSLGRIDVTFQPSGQVRVIKPDLSQLTTNCVAASRIVRKLGRFTGTIQFEGESGYTSVNASSAVGTVGTSAFRNCRQKPPVKGAGPPDGNLWVSGSRGSGPSQQSVSFGALAGGSTCPKGRCFNATMVEVLSGGSGDVAIEHEAHAVGPLGAFTYNALGLDSATVRPPAPFSGSATFTDNGKSTWKGDLGVAFPGGATGALVGPGYFASLTGSG